MDSQGFDSTEVAELEAQIIAVLKENKDGLTSETLATKTPNATNLMRSEVVNNLLSTNKIEMLTSQGPAGPSLILRLRRGTQLENVSAEEQLVNFIFIIKKKSELIVFVFFFRFFHLLKNLKQKGYGFVKYVISRVLVIHN